MTNAIPFNIDPRILVSGPPGTITTASGVFYLGGGGGEFPSVGRRIGGAQFLQQQARQRFAVIRTPPPIKPVSQPQQIQYSREQLAQLQMEKTASARGLEQLKDPDVFLSVAARMKAGQTQRYINQQKSLLQQEYGKIQATDQQLAQKQAALENRYQQINESMKGGLTEEQYYSAINQISDFEKQQAVFNKEIQNRNIAVENLGRMQDLARYNIGQRIAQVESYQKTAQAGFARQRFKEAAPRLITQKQAEIEQRQRVQELREGIEQEDIFLAARKAGLEKGKQIESLARPGAPKPIVKAIAGVSFGVETAFVGLEKAAGRGAVRASDVFGFTGEQKFFRKRTPFEEEKRIKTVHGIGKELGGLAATFAITAPLDVGMFALKAARISKPTLEQAERIFYLQRGGQKRLEEFDALLKSKRGEVPRRFRERTETITIPRPIEQEKTFGQITSDFARMRPGYQELGEVRTGFRTRQAPGEIFRIKPVQAIGFGAKGISKTLYFPKTVFGLLPREKQKEEIGFGIGLGVSAVDKSFVGTIPAYGIKAIEKQQQKPAFRYATALETKTITKTTLFTPPKPIMPRQPTMPRFRFEAQPKPKPSKPPEIKPPGRLIWDWPKPKPEKTIGAVMRSLFPAFAVEVKRKGKFETVGFGLPKGRATQLGARITALTTARTFRLLPGGFTEKKDIPFQLSERIFRLQKRGTGFVERTRFAISEPLEKIGIPGRAAALRRAGLLGVKHKR